MKKNGKWAIKCSNEQMFAYKETLKALGYKILPALDNDVAMNGFAYLVYEKSDGQVIRVGCHRAIVFENIEEFLQWYFAPGLTAEQKQILELEATIKQAQEQIAKLKATAQA